MITPVNAIMLFAAGFGTRMRPLTDAQPKPLVKVAGKPLIDHALALVHDAGVPKTVANLHYLPNMLIDHLKGTGVQTIVEKPDILDTGGGLRNALPILGPDPVFTMNTDAIWAGPNPLRLLQAAWDPERMDALLIGIPCKNAVAHGGTGDFSIATDGRMQRGDGLVYGGAQIVSTELLANIGDDVFSLNVLWDQMIKRGRLYGLTYPGKWCDVGHPGGIRDAEDLLANV